jgi:hypothetical protein
MRFVFCAKVSGIFFPASGKPSLSPSLFGTLIAVKLQTGSLLCSGQNRTENELNWKKQNLPSQLLSDMSLVRYHIGG